MIPERLDNLPPETPSPEAARRLLEGFLKAIRDEQQAAELEARPEAEAS